MILLILLQYSFSATTPLQTWQSIQSIEYRNQIDNETLELFASPYELSRINGHANIDNYDIDLDRYENESDQVGKKILDHSFRNLIKGRMTPESDFFERIEQIEQSMKYDISIPKENPDDIEHKFNLQYQPFQNMAKVRYSGLFNAYMEYFFGKDFLELSIDKSLSEDLLVSLKHGKDPTSTHDEMSMLYLQWKWK